MANDEANVFSLTERTLLGTAMDRIVPPDRDPGAIGFGADKFVVAMLAGDAAKERERIRAGLAFLEAQAQRRFARRFVELPPLEQDELLHLVAGEAWFRALVTLTIEGVYADPGNGGNVGATSWAMVGYRHGVPEGPCGPPRGSPRYLPPPRNSIDYDVVVVGAGAGGGITACVLAEAGKRVLLLERGQVLDYRSNGHRDHLRNQWLPRYGHNAGPRAEGNPRVFVASDESERLVAPHERDYQNVGAGVGSGTVFYGGQAWRFHADDFRMASRYGVPEGSSLVDWPFGYDEMALWYARAEVELGVAGNAADWADGRRYPLAPHPHYEAARVLAEGAAKLGLATVTPPLLINSTPHNGRAACIECGTCVGFPCPVDAKTGTHNTAIPRALATGNCHLIVGAQAERVVTDRSDKVTGVAYVGERGDRAVASAKAVVLSCGAIETARLLLLSASSAHPAGLGNDYDQVGRHLQGHVYPAAVGLFDFEVQNSRGPGVTIATCDYVHGNDGVIGGAMLADDFVMTPITLWHMAWPPDLLRWGVEAKDFMRDHYRHVLQVKGPVHEIPNPESRVTLAATTDRFGLRVARLSGAIHPETLRTAHFIHDRIRDWLGAAGAGKIWGEKPKLALSAHSHQAGTCRMGTDPRLSVTDGFGRVWDHENLFVADAALHPTNGAFNPVLTIFALAYRNATHIAQVV